VMDPFPPAPDNPLLHRDNVIMTPHVASASHDGKARIYEIALNQAAQVLRGECPPHLVNPEVWERVVERREQQRRARPEP
jgi:D-3-phosphoglycerate dehydrogenase / 2-oxoglutarate reductase